MKLKYIPFIIALVAATACGKKDQPSAISNANAATTASAADTKKVMSQGVAEVNGMVLTNTDILPYLAQGADRAVAVDRAINKAIAAELARKEFESDANAAIAAAERDVAAQVYLNKKAETLAKTISDKEIQTRYDILVKDADFNAYKLKVAVVQSEAEARDVIEKSRKSMDSEKRLVPLSTAGEGYIGKNDIPYGLGAVISELRSGEYSQPLVTRNGVMVFYMADVKRNEKPKLEAVKEQIRASITQERVSEAIMKAREDAKISLK